MSTTTHPKLRLWVLPWGLYPRRVTIYLKEKGIQDEFDIIPVEITQQGQVPAPGKPAGSMPILEISPPTTPDGDDGQYIFQSTAILEYLEDVYGPQSGKPDMRGATPAGRARGRECMDVLNEAVAFMGFYMHNASKLFVGMEAQSAGAAKAALQRTHKMFDLLEKLADMQGPWLTSSGDNPLVVDCVLMATMQFAKEVYSVDIGKDHTRLQKVMDAFKGRESAALEHFPPGICELASQMEVR